MARYPGWTGRKREQTWAGRLVCSEMGLSLSELIEIAQGSTPQDPARGCGGWLGFPYCGNRTPTSMAQAAASVRRSVETPKGRRSDTLCSQWDNLAL